MHSEVFLREDITALLAAIALTAAATGGNSPHDAAYRRGFAAAIGAVATGLHIAPGAIAARLQPFAELGRLTDREAVRR